jgi:hypothetical protein
LPTRAYGATNTQRTNAQCTLVYSHAAHVYSHAAHAAHIYFTK